MTAASYPIEKDGKFRGVVFQIYRLRQNINVCGEPILLYKMNMCSLGIYSCLVVILLKY